MIRLGHQEPARLMESPLFRYAPLQTRFIGAGHAIGVIVLAFAVGIALSIGGIVLSAFAFGGSIGGGNLPTEAIAITSAMQFVGFILVAYGYVRYRGVTLFEFDTPSLEDIGYIVGGFVALFASSMVLGLIIQALGADSATNSVVEVGNRDPVFFLYMIPVALFLVGPGEELVFRGVVQGLIREAYGVVPAVLITSLLFGLAHVLALSGSGKVTYIAVAAVLGIVLGVVYELSGNLLVPTVIHGFWNSMLFLINWYGAVYGLPEQAAMVLPW